MDNNKSKSKSKSKSNGSKNIVTRVQFSEHKVVFLPCWSPVKGSATDEDGNKCLPAFKPTGFVVALEGPDGTLTIDRNCGNGPRHEDAQDKSLFPSGPRFWSAVAPGFASGTAKVSWFDRQRDAAQDAAERIWPDLLNVAPEDVSIADREAEAARLEAEFRAELRKSLGLD